MARHQNKAPAAPRVNPNRQKLGNASVAGDEYRDGWTSKASYLVIAKTADNSRALAVRYVGGQVRVHAYPTFRAFGITPTTNAWHRESLGYMSTWIPGKDLKAFLAQMTKLRGMNLMDMDEIQTKLKMVLVDNDDPTGFTPLPDGELDHPEPDNSTPPQDAGEGWGEETPLDPDDET